MLTSLRVPGGSEEAAGACACHPERIRALRRYLSERFPQYASRHFHSRTRLMHAGQVSSHASHHVISLTHVDVLPYYAVILQDFLAHTAPGIAGRLQQWDLADMLRSHRMVIVSDDGVFPL
jgi:hypothetical protein